MCGIIGVWNNSGCVIDTEKLLLRGRDGIGYYSSANGLVKNKHEHSLGGVHQVFIGNSRAVPTTEFEQGAGLDEKNQQPFENDRFVVVHNGILSNDKELIKKYDLKPSSLVDTAILPDLFSEVGVVEGLRKLKGSFAVICYDKRYQKLFVAKNFMPLRITQNDKGFKFASIKEMFQEDEKNEEIEPYVCYEIDAYNKLNKHSLYLNERNEKVLVICSGGTDSVTTAYIYKYYGYDVSLLHFNYGQAAQDAETFAVKKIAKLLDADLRIIDAKPIFAMFKDSSILLNQTEAKKENKILDAESTLSYVPNRNAIFSMIAAGIAEMEKIDTVAFGGQQMDSVYPDNNPTFVDAVDNLLKYSLDMQVNIKFSAPLIHCMKHEIYQLGQFIGVPYDWVTSCYYPKIEKNKLIACNECGCCQFRRGAMEMIGYKDRQSNTDISVPKIKLIQNHEKFLNDYIKRCL